MDRELKCFVACAFGRTDVDNMFKKIIVPTLKSLKVKALRVDTINHNKNIDIKIIELIRDCDFGISDLTYARPSVYYEAGYIHGLGKEVIFTVRADHFKPNEKDIEGNRRVHFDLANKNIIDWTDNKTSFQKKLKSRITLITKPILTEKRAIQAIEKEEKSFDTLSLVSKIGAIKTESKTFIKNLKYKIGEEEEGLVTGWKKDGDKKSVIMVFTYDSLTLKKLSNFNNFSWIIRKVAGIDILEQSTLTIVFNVLRPVSVSTIQRALPNFQILPDKKAFIQHETLTGRAINYYIIDNIRSVTDYKAKQKEFNVM